MPQAATGPGTSPGTKAARPQAAEVSGERISRDAHIGFSFTAGLTPPVVRIFCRARKPFNQFDEPPSPNFQRQPNIDNRSEFDRKQTQWYGNPSPKSSTTMTDEAQC